MGLRVGVVTGDFEPGAGGAWTFSAMLTGALKTAESSHTFIVLDEISPGGESKRPAGGRLRRILRQRPDDENINRTEPLAGREGVDLVWLMKPWSEPLSVPYIATVWDLEHRKQPYFPEVSATGWTWPARENVYNALLPRASMIIAGTQVGKEEVIRYYHVNPANVMVIPFPAPAGALLVQSSDAARIKEKYRVNGDFLLYPAQFWPHKNHINLLKALRLLRNQTDLDLSLVLTGSDKGNRNYVVKHVVELGLGDRVLVPGFVPREDLNALYRASTALVFPSYFGPDNFPPLEAFALSCPVIAANVPGAEEQLGQGALLFNPSDPSDIAVKIQHVCRKPALRAQMISIGNEIAKLRTSQAYIAALCAFLDRFEAIRRCWGAAYQHL
jgi:glycosyltransferase involved in cell wall biosynthesis